MLDTPSVQQALAEKYGGSIGEDRGGRKIQVLPATGDSLKILPSELDQFDVFVAWEEDPLRFMGWIPAAACEDAPTVWLEKKGRRVDYYHKVLSPFLFDMPDQFEFVAPCEHDAAFWNYAQDAWECLVCPKCFHDERQRGVVNGL